MNELIQSPETFLRFGGALVGVLALILLAVVVARAIGVAPKRARNRGEKRLELIDTLTLDPKRRLVLVRRDSVEHLLLLTGSDDLIIEQGIPDAASVPAMEAAAPATVPEDSHNGGYTPAPIHADAPSPYHQPGSPTRGPGGGSAPGPTKVEPTL